VSASARLGDRAYDCAPARRPRGIRICGPRAVLALELDRAGRRRCHVGRFLDRDAQPTRRIGLRGARDAAVPARQDGGVAAAGELQTLDHVDDRADVRVLGLVTRYQEDLFLLADVDREGHGHAREDDGVVEGDQSQGRHAR
jgi:hypothetical protein